MGACRRACCVGWPIFISVDNYFLINGIECSNALRMRLDKGLKLAITPTSEHYAQISPRYDGDCSMRLEDGRCAIHAELGEGVLPDVCRLYPRGVRSQPTPECSLTNSCEAVLELLINKASPITFEVKPIDIVPPPSAKRIHSFHTMNRETDIRLCLIRCIQNRAVPLKTRILNLGYLMKGLEEVLSTQNEQALNELLAEEPKTPSLEADFGLGLDITKRFVLSLSNRSDSIKEYGEAALLYCGDTQQLQSRYREAASHFEGLFPNWQIFFEHMLVNYMFFEQFPFQDRPDTLWHEYMALCGLYSVLRFIACTWMADKYAESDLIDVCAAIFRLVQHTSFDRFAAKALTSLGCTSPKEAISLTLI